MTAPEGHAGAMRLSVLVHMERRARQASAHELPFVMVNETARLAPYRQAALLVADADGRLRLKALSATSAPDPSGPFGSWLTRICRRAGAGEAPSPFQASDLPPELAAEWNNWLPAHGLRLPLHAPQGTFLGELLLWREPAWTEADIGVLGMLAETYALCLRLHAVRQTRDLQGWLASRPKKLWLALAAVVVLSLLPVRHNVLVPAEVTPVSPMLIRAPFDGVVDKISVTPNQDVSKDQPLFSLDEQQLQTRLVVAKKSLDAALAQLQQAQQLALYDPKAKASLVVLKGRVDQLQAETDFASHQLDRHTVLSPAGGVVIMSDPQEWLGRPVLTGQKILTVADPAQLELELHLPMADAIPLPEAARVDFFPATNPGSPIPARVRFHSYQAQMTPEAGMAYRLLAGFDASHPDVRVGARGVAKVFGERSVLAAVVFKKPLAMLRQWLMW